jgi:hypothetical protein
MYLFLYLPISTEQWSIVERVQMQEIINNNKLL